MKIKCVRLEVLENITNSKKEAIEITNYANNFLELGKSYNVYGISLWRNGLNYLIDVPLNDKPSPEWFPVEHFEIIDFALPNNMYFRNFETTDKRGLKALCGYNELVYDYSHYEGLIEMDESAIEIFVQRKEEIDNQST